MDKCREEFEKWCEENTGWDLYWSENINQYMDHQTNGAWLVWQHKQAKVEELQKRVDTALLEIKGAARWIDEDAIDDPDFIKGGALTALRRLEQALKGEG